MAFAISGSCGWSEGCQSSAKKRSRACVTVNAAALSGTCRGAPSSDKVGSCTCSPAVRTPATPTGTLSRAPGEIPRWRTLEPGPSSHQTLCWSKGDSNLWSHPERQRSEEASHRPPFNSLDRVRTQVFAGEKRIRTCPVTASVLRSKRSEFFYAIKREGLGFPAPRSYRGKKFPPCRCGKAKRLLHAPPKVLIG